MKNKTREYERYFWLSLILAALGNVLVFRCSRLLIRGRLRHSLTLPFDFALPFLPWTISIYLGCLLLWFFLYRIAAGLPRQRADRFYLANLLGKGFCFLIFVLFPTGLVRPEPGDAGFWNGCMRLLYQIDAPDDLFPSLHCFLGWLCWVGVRGNREVPLAWRISALLMAFAVCFSTLTTRQHVFLDTVGGVLLCELCYGLAGSPALLKRYGAFVDALLGVGRKKSEQKGGETP